MKSLFYLLLLVIIMLSLSTCYYSKEDVLYAVNTCDTTNVTFRGKVASVFANHCLSCHGNAVSPPNGGGIRLQDPADLKANIYRAYGAMSHQKGFLPMPKDMTETIDPCEIKTVKIWMDAGALNN